MHKIAFLAVFLAIAPAHPAPLYFTFTGTVSFVPSDIGGDAAAHGIRAGSPVTYIFMADTAREGFTRLQGTNSPKADVVNPGYHQNNFFDSLIAPSLFSPAVTDSASGSYLGYRTTTQAGGTTRYSLAFQATIGNPDHRTQVVLAIPDSGTAEFLPKVGDKVTGGETYIDSSVASSSASMVLTLTAISATRPSLGVVARPSRAGPDRRADSPGEGVYFGTGAGRALVDGNGREIIVR